MVCGDYRILTNVEITLYYLFNNLFNEYYSKKKNTIKLNKKLRCVDIKRKPQRKQFTINISLHISISKIHLSDFY